MINVENHGDWIHLSLFNLQKDRVFIIVFFVQWYSSFLLVRLFCLFAFYLSLTPVFFSCFLLIGFRIWIHFSGVSFYFECAASRFQYNRWILFFFHLNNIWALVWLPFHKCAQFLSPVANERRKSLRDYDFLLILFIVERDFFFLRLMIKNDDRIIARYDHEILT